MAASMSSGCIHVVGSHGSLSAQKRQALDGRHGSCRVKLGRQTASKLQLSSAWVAATTLSVETGRGSRESQTSRRVMQVCCASAASPPSSEPLRVIIAGAPASGKGTQCELIVEKYGLAHISAGDLLRAEVAKGSEYGKQVSSFMDAGQLVPDEVVITIVKSRLNSDDAKTNGWLLDGYPRSASQAAALAKAGIEPDVFILLQVPDEILVDRVVGRRMDPETGRIYHLSFSPPESEEVTARLVQRSDDTEEKVKLRLETHNNNMGNVTSSYSDVLIEVDGNRGKDLVFADVEKILDDLRESKAAAAAAASAATATGAAAAAAVSNSSPEAGGGEERRKEAWKGVPTRLNDIPHSREIRRYFYLDVCLAAAAAVADGQKQLKVELLIPELNPEMDVYRIGTLLELLREMAFAFARDGRRVKVCVQGPMGSGIFTGMPLQLSGTRRMLELMDWSKPDNPIGGENPDDVTYASIKFGAVGAAEVAEDDDIFIVMAPQNAVGNCIIDDLSAMVEAANSRGKPLIIVNPRLKDIPGAGGVMQVTGREERMAFSAAFFPCYSFRLLYRSGTQYPIMGAMRMAYPGPYEVYRRDDVGFEKEEYKLMDTFDRNPTSSDISDAFAGRKREEPKGIWAILAKIIN